MKLKLTLISALLLSGTMAGAANNKVTASIPGVLSSPEEISSMVDRAITRAVGPVYSQELLDQAMTEVISANKPDSQEWSVEVYDLNTGQTFEYNADEMLGAASSVKLFVIGAAYENWELCTSQVSEKALEGLINAILFFSDNDSATRLVEILGQGDTTAGKDVVNAYCEKYGFDSTILGILFTGVDPTGTGNGTSAKDTADFVSMLYHNELPGSAQILAGMEQSQRTSKIPAALPEGTKTGNKTGELDDIQNDTAIIYGSRPFILSVMISNTEEEQGVENIQKLAAQAWSVLEDGKALETEDSE